MEPSSEEGQKLSAFISQLLSGVVESVHQQGYQVVFLASKVGDGRDEILSLHGGLSLNIQKQIEVNFKNLIKEATHSRDCSIWQSPEEAIQSNHTVSIPITDDLAASSSHSDLTSNTRTVMESAANVDTIKVEYTAKFDACLTGDAEYSPTTNNYADEQVECNDGEGVNGAQKQEPEPPNDIQIDHDDSRTVSILEPVEPCTASSTETTATSANTSYEYLRGKKKCKYCEFSTKDKSIMIRHKSKHTGEKPFACPQCPYRSANKTCMKRHIMTHTGEKPFACQYCPFRSAQKKGVTRHTAKAHLKAYT